MRRLRGALAERGRFVVAAAATWSPIWNMTLLAKATAADANDKAARAVASNGRVSLSCLARRSSIATMNTYADTEPGFASQLEAMLAVFPPAAPAATVGRLVVGVGDYWTQLNTSEATQHFALLRASNVCHIAIWDMPIPSALWWTLLMDLATRCHA